MDVVTKEQVTKTTHFKSGMIQSWNKFCFTGGIVEVDVILPGEPDIGGLWPAMWLLGNLGRATYEASTNNLWPWSYDKCDRKKQDSQSISACDKANHFGLNKEQGRGATEIDILELMGGDSGGKALPATEPPIMLPYADMTLQVSSSLSLVCLCVVFGCLCCAVSTHCVIRSELCNSLPTLHLSSITNSSTGCSRYSR